MKKVVCINDHWGDNNYTFNPVKDEIYTVIDIKQHSGNPFVIGYALAECPVGWWFNATHFVDVDEIELSDVTIDSLIEEEVMV